MPINIFATGRYRDHGNYALDALREMPEFQNLLSRLASNGYSTMELMIGPNVALGRSPVTVPQADGTERVELQPISAGFRRQGNGRVLIGINSNVESRTNDGNQTTVRSIESRLIHELYHLTREAEAIADDAQNENFVNAQADQFVTNFLGEPSNTTNYKAMF